ncbi:MAG TPA: beta-galactosidase trimerization domain-containing protein [Terriglobia bacterium]|nr:beta-galactosidase trimerization domain-containing protein [Terriglobia bacterium]
MDRRIFLADALTRLGVLAGIPHELRALSPGMTQQNTADKAVPPSDHYELPDWLHYARTVYFDGYSPPIYPHVTQFDAQRLVKLVKEVGGDLLRFQPVGYRAYYPSKAFPVDPELGGRDLIDEMSRECRANRLHVYCYMGYGAPIMLGPEYIKEHPEYADWLLRDPAGKPYGLYWHIGWLPPLQRLCTTGDAYRSAIRRAVRELCEYDIDGVYFDSPSAFGYTGVCFCDSCRRNFQNFSGLDLDRLAVLATPDALPFDWGNIPANVDLKTLVAWYSWANQLTLEDLFDFRKIIHGAGKFMLCHNGATWVGTSLRFQYRVPDGFMVEASREVYDRLMAGMKGASMVRPYHKVAQMYLGSYATSWFAEPPHEDPWVVHNTNLEDGDEILMEGFANLACGNTPLYATANRLYFNVGSGSAKPVKEVFEVMRKVENVHRGSVPVPYLTIVPTWESLQLWRTNRHSWNWPMMSEGMGLLLLDARISFDVNPSTEMTPEWLRQQTVIALCGASGISDRDAQNLTVWVKGGGGLLATYDAGLYDERGELREDGGALKEILGVEMNGEPLESQPECYYRIIESHPALAEYRPTSVVEGDGRLVPVKARSGANVIAECWNLGTQEVRGPAIVANVCGHGRSIYISGSLEANYLYDRVPSTARLMRSVLNYLGRGLPQPYKLTAPQGVYGVLRRAGNGDLALWVLANVGFKDADAGRMRQSYIPMTNVEVAIHVPGGRKPKEMRLIRAGRTISFEQRDGYAVGTIPSVHVAEIVHLVLV